MTEPFSEQLQRRLDDALDLDQVLPPDGDLPDQGETLLDEDVDHWVQAAVKDPVVADAAPAGLVRSFRRRRLGKRVSTVGVLVALAAFGSRHHWSGRSSFDLPYREAFKVVFDETDYTEENRNSAMIRIGGWCRHACDALGRMMERSPDSGARDALKSIRAQLLDPRPGDEISWWDPPIKELVVRVRDGQGDQDDVERLARMVRAGVLVIREAKGSSPLLSAGSDALFAQLTVLVGELLGE